jgi:hypothetical protein
MVRVMDLVFFAKNSLNLFITPEYYTQLVAFSLLLSIIAAGTPLYKTNKRLSCGIIITGIVLFSILIRAAFLPFFGIAVDM